MIVRALKRLGRTKPRGCRSGRSRSRSFAIGSRGRSRSCGFPGSIIFGCVRRTCLSVRTRRSSGGRRSSGFFRTPAAVRNWSGPCARRPVRTGWRTAAAAKTWIFFKSSGGPTWPRRGAASTLRGRIRNAENRIHAFGFARGASNPKPGLDMPERNCRTIGTLLAALRARRRPVHQTGGKSLPAGHLRRPCGSSCSIRRAISRCFAARSSSALRCCRGRSSRHPCRSPPAPEARRTAARTRRCGTGRRPCIIFRPAPAGRATCSRFPGSR